MIIFEDKDLGLLAILGCCEQAFKHNFIGVRLY